MARPRVGAARLVGHAGPTTADPTIIRIVLVNPLTAPAVLSGDNIKITGGVRFPPPKIDPNVTAGPGPVTYSLTIPGGQPTDFSTYRLALVTGPDNDAPPSFIDPRLSAVDFSFKVGCPSDLDCRPECAEVMEPSPGPDFDYRVRDYQGFRRQLLDRLAELVPGFREDDPVDFTTTLIEALAYRADQQSYRLDWVGTEAFLATARSRTSITRHARLVDYPPVEGASARVFARFTFKAGGGVADGMQLEAATPLLVRSEGLRNVVPASDYRRVLTQNPIVFETMAPLTLWQWRNSIAFYTWGDGECRLVKGATAATLVDASGGAGALAPGDLLLLAETRSPETGSPADARADRRHVVRLTQVTPTTDVLLNPSPSLVTVEWADADALPFDLVIQSPIDNVPGGDRTRTYAEAAGNIMLADHGASAPPAPMLGLPRADVEALRPTLTPPTPVDDTPWRPVLDRTDIARVAPIDLTALPPTPAAVLATVDPSRSLPALFLDDDFDIWTAQRDLLESGAFAREFVIENEIHGRPAVRFGDGVNGLAPVPGTVLVARGRFGSGPSGNIGSGALAHVVLPLPQQGADVAVTNPLPARGGLAPELISAIRVAAPQAFRRQERAVTAADYASAAKHHPEVANAAAVPHWTGAWQTMLVYVTRKEGRPVDKVFRRTLLDHLEFYRLMGFDIALRGALAAPLDIELFICAQPDELRSTAAARVRDALRPSGGGSGQHGFFHADNFTFGSPLYLSKLIAAVIAIEGVQSVMPRKFQRLGRLSQGEITSGVIRPGSFEVLQLEDDPSFPERGRLTLAMGGGR